MSIIQSIIQQVENKFADSISQSQGIDGIFEWQISSDRSFELVKFLKEESGFNYLTDLCGAHYPDNNEQQKFAVIYHIHNWIENIRFRIKVYLNENPHVDSLVPLFLSANWQERETYDFYGIIFNDHPDLRRVLNMDEMESFPLRKEFPMEDGGRTDKDDRYFGRIPKNVTQ